MKVRQSDLQDAILRAALDPACWSDVLSELCALAPGTATHFIGQDRSYHGSMPLLYQGYAAEVAVPYAQHYQFTNPLRAGWSQLSVGSVCSHSDLVAGEVWSRSEFLNDWLRPQGFSGAVGTILAQDESRVFTLACHTNRFESERRVAAIMAKHLPILRHALNMNRVFLGLRFDEYALRQGTDPAGAALLALTDSGKVAYCNPMASDMLARGVQLSLSARGILQAQDARLQFCLDGARRYRQPSRVRVRNRASELFADVIPMDDQLKADLNRGPLGNALACSTILILSRPEVREVSAGDLAGLLGLTQAEAKISLLLADGLTAEEIADRRGVSLHTVRNQIKSALAKTGARRQVELVKETERGLMLLRSQERRSGG